MTADSAQSHPIPPPRRALSARPRAWSSARLPLTIAVVALLGGPLMLPMEMVGAYFCNPLAQGDCLPEPTGTPLSGANIGVNKACTEQGGTYTGRTTAANDNGLGFTNDVTLGDNVLDAGSNTVLVAMNYVFDALIIDVGTGGTAGAVAWEYWNGTAYTGFSGVSDGTNNLGTTGIRTVSWNVPADWDAHDPGVANCSGKGYHMRLRTTTNYLALPLADQISAREFNFQVAAKNELNTALTGLAQTNFTVKRAGATGDSTVYAFRNLLNGSYEFALMGAGDARNYTVEANFTGYQKSAAVFAGPLNSTLRLADSPILLNFSYKVSSVAAELGAALSGVTVKAGNGSSTTCTESGSAWYCPVPLNDTSLTIQAAKDGYVTNELSSFASDRTNNADAQVVGTVTGVKYGLKVTVPTEADLTGIAFEKKIGVGSWNGVAADASSTNVAYFAQSPTQADLVYRGTKGAITNTTGTAFTTSAAAQTEKEIHLIGTLSGTSVRVRDLTASANTSYNFTFTTVHDWPATGILEFYFPAAYSYGAPAATLTGITGTASVQVLGDTVKLTRSGGSTLAGGSTVSVLLSQIINPASAGAPGAINMSLRNAVPVILDTGNVSGVDIQATPLVEFQFVAGADRIQMSFSPAGPGDWFADSFESGGPSPVEVDAAASNRNILLYFDPDDFQTRVNVTGTGIALPLSGLDYQTSLSPAPSAGTWRDTGAGLTRAWSSAGADYPGLWIFFDDRRNAGTIGDNASLMAAANEAATSTVNNGNRFSPALIFADSGDTTSPTTLPAAARLRWSSGQAPSVSDYAFEVAVPLYTESAGGSASGTGGTLSSRYVQILMRADGSEVAVREGGAAPLGADWDVSGWDRAKAPDGLLGDETLDDYQSKNVLVTLFGNRYTVASTTTGGSPKLDLAQALVMPLRTPASGGVFHAAIAFPADAPKADYTWSFALNAVNWSYDDDTANTPDEVQWP